MDMDLKNLDRYSIDVLNDDTLVLTDTATLQTWKIEILRNICKEQDHLSTESKPDPK